jgi:phosphomannomutase
MGRLFGTDGVRGKAGDYPLDVKTVRRVGAALARTLRRDEPVRLLAGRDTRESGSWIERELAFGITTQVEGSPARASSRLLPWPISPRAWATRQAW